MCSLLCQVLSFFSCSTQINEREKQYQRTWFRRLLQRPQEQSPMAVVLKTLEQTMDPLIAAQVWNNKHSLLARLPDEILLEIFSSLGDDAVSLYCLRRTCRTFRRLLGVREQRFWRVISPASASARISHPEENYLRLSLAEANQLKQLLQKDGMCEKCAVYCDGPVKGVIGRFIHYWCSEYGPKRVFQASCKFKGRGADLGKCPSCGIYHDMVSFSKKETPKVETRKCLGREGSVQLCEHVHIPWSQIENHLKNWPSPTTRDWETCFDTFNIECRHPSHDSRCIPEEAPTWPRARLGYAEFDSSRVVLILEWKPHSGFGYFNITDGKMPAQELRELFKEYRQGAARIFLPAYPSNPLPEMVCFDLKYCNCTHYETGQQDGKSTTEDPEDPDQYIFEERLWYYNCNSSHSLQRKYGRGDNGQRVDHKKHCPKGFGGPTCLITRYRRDITVYRKSDIRLEAIPPTHEWFHAMDPDTYPHPNNPHALPRCKDEKCMNYYKKPQTYCSSKRRV